ncbi:CBL-interacting serine/threonine-protein kinase 1-like isoform X2 [Cucurbita pepo subsp. pepo]|uniref:CBL-interacting serine/threonine-protein kinase 1-like isoform X2 n=1 Tax=Cucurbita pepo subsp. pepo TaxID=3664 RepID=UPI000C9D3870|nr:CBL-interacting serine/threonine-protein kinase 1-like isoform X2 [Cucurbita pepo subsp. pepo]
MVGGGRGEENEDRAARVRLGKYELGKTLGHGNFGKVKLAINFETDQPFAVKVLDKTKIIDLNISDQFKREIRTLKLLKHPNIVRLHEVLASKSKIYMVLEYVNGGELFNRIASNGKLSEDRGRKIFQQLIDGVSYCHWKGVYHRDLKLENILVDAKGNIKISDFGLSALPEHLRNDGLLHTTCGSPNYVAPEILANRGYDGAASDVWSCGVILYVILTGSLPFEDRNLCVLYNKILKGETQLPKWLSQGAQNLIRRILDPNPISRITMASIKMDEWFRKDYDPAYLDDDEEDINTQNEAIPTHQEPSYLEERSPRSPTTINAFELIGMSSCLDLSGLFEKEDVSERKIRFTTIHSAKEDILNRMEDLVKEMGFLVHKKEGRLKVMREHKGQNGVAIILSVSAKVFEISPSLYVIELRKVQGESSSYRQLCKILSSDLGIPSRQGSVMT